MNDEIKHLAELNYPIDTTDSMNHVIRIAQRNAFIAGYQAALGYEKALKLIEGQEHLHLTKVEVTQTGESSTTRIEWTE